MCVKCTKMFVGKLGHFVTFRGLIKTREAMSDDWHTVAAKPQRKVAAPKKPQEREIRFAAVLSLFFCLPLHVALS
jgi:hypothetical protein